MFVTEEAAITLRQAGAEATALLVASGLSATARRDAELLLMHVTGLDRAQLLTRPEYRLSADDTDHYRRLVARRAASEPLQYITGAQEFFGLRFKVTPDVLIPRPETEHLVEAVLTRVAKDGPARIVDVGSGSGAIAVALAHSLPRAELTALDISPAALKAARQNAENNGVADRIRFVESNLFSAIAGERFDIIVSNPPYIAESDRLTLEAQVRDYEPHRALFAGPTGLEIYQRLIPQAAALLMPGGWLMLEIGAGQKSSLQQLLESWSNVDFLPDLQGIPRVAVAQLP